MTGLHSLYMLCGLLAGALLVYLLAALFNPEDFA